MQVKHFFRTATETYTLRGKTIKQGDNLLTGMRMPSSVPSHLSPTGRRTATSGLVSASTPVLECISRRSK